MRLLLPLVGVLAALASPAKAQQNWLSEDFETFPPVGWSSSDIGVGGWTDGTPYSTAPFVIDQMAFHGDYAGQCDSRLISPSMDFTGVSGPIWAHWFDYMNRFPHLLHAGSSQGNGASSLEVSLDGGSNWTVVWIEIRTGGQAHANHVDLSSYAGESSVMLAWRYWGDDAHWWGIDEVRVDDTACGIIRNVVDPVSGTEYISSYKGDWAWATAAGAELGAVPVCIEDSAENEFVWREFVLWDSLESSTTRFIPRSIWMGATDENVEGNWEWLDGTPWSWTNWGPGEPNNDPNASPMGEDYARMDILTGEWLDKAGDISVFTVFEIVPPPTGPLLSITGPCPGQATIAVTGASPDKQVFIAWSPSLTPWTLLFTPCAGTVFDIANPNLAIARVADANGEVSVARTLPAIACGFAHVQALDANTCTVTNVVSL